MANEPTLAEKAELADRLVNVVLARKKVNDLEDAIIHHADPSKLGSLVEAAVDLLTRNVYRLDKSPLDDVSAINKGFAYTYKRSLIWYVAGTQSSQYHFFETTAGALILEKNELGLLVRQPEDDKQY